MGRGCWSAARRRQASPQTPCHHLEMRPSSVNYVGRQRTPLCGQGGWPQRDGPTPAPDARASGLSRGPSACHFLRAGIGGPRCSASQRPPASGSAPPGTAMRGTGRRLPARLGFRPPGTAASGARLQNRPLPRAAPSPASEAAPRHPPRPPLQAAVPRGTPPPRNSMGFELARAGLGRSFGDGRRREGRRRAAAAPA